MVTYAGGSESWNTIAYQVALYNIAEPILRSTFQFSDSYSEEANDEPFVETPVKSYFSQILAGGYGRPYV